jgi:hypothetical protein
MLSSEREHKFTGKLIMIDSAEGRDKNFKFKSLFFAIEYNSLIK